MTNEGDLRWEQRFDNYQKALKKLSEAIDYVKNDLKVNESDLEIGDSYEVLEEIIKEGLIQRFEYTYELAWNMMKDYAMYQGNPEIGGSRDAIRYAFSSNLIADGDVWMDMIKSRVKTSHTYNKEMATHIYLKIIEDYFPVFLRLEVKMASLRNTEY